MKKYLSKTLSGILAVSMIFSSFIATSVAAAPSFSKAGGWNETIYAELSGVKDANVTGVSYSGTMTGTLEGEDFQYLVRDSSGGVRIDIPGLKPGTYSLTVNTSSGNAVKENIVVPAQDRSGYAHFNYTQGVGGYNDDGTLKANAKVLYVTNENKDSVTVSSSDGTTVSGIGNILNSAGGKPKTSSSGSILSNVINTNQDIIRKLALDGTPLVVRFVGGVKAPEGLTAFNSPDYGGTKGDNGFMARMQSGKDITLEGIGYDATIDGWGIHFMCQSSNPDLGKSFEVRNIAFKNVPEDCVGMEGVQTDNVLTASVERCWIHNCSFYAPVIANPAASDKDGGDGACDFKRGQYFTNSYCFYNGYHKTNLVGANDDNLQFHITYHHNYWKNCEARGPLGRQANIHMYNNYFERQSSYAMNTRANCYIFSEYNLFYKCKESQLVKTGAIKSYKDSLTACSKPTDAVVVTDKNQKVSSGNRYENFDTDSSVSYIPSKNYKLIEDVTMVKKSALACSGVMPENVISPEDLDITATLADRQPTASVQLPYDKDLNRNYATPGQQVIADNIIFNATKGEDSYIVIGGSDSKGQDIVFNVNQKARITMTDGAGQVPVMLTNDNGVGLFSGSGSIVVEPGTYFIQSSGIQLGDGDKPDKFKEAKITHLSIVSAGSEEPTMPEPTTQATTAAVETSTQATTSVVEKPTQSTTQAPVVSARGNVNKDKKIDAVDAAIVLRIAAGIITNTSAYDMKAADCDTEAGDGNVDIKDAMWILNNQGSAESPTTTEATTEATTSGPVDDGVIYNSMTISRNSNSSYATVFGDKNSSGEWCMDKSRGSTVRGYIMIKLGKTADVTINGGGEKTVWVSQTVGDKEGQSLGKAASVTAKGLSAGTWYIYNQDGIHTISDIVVNIN